jgi:hypothetical protein
MLSNSFGKNCLTAAAVAACVLTNYKVPYKVVVGYFHFLHPESKEALVATAFPHVWLETKEGVTDLAYSDVARKILVLGQGIGFHDDAVRPTYSVTPLLPVFQGKEGGPKPIGIDVLGAVAKDLTAYLDQSPPYVQREVSKILTSAFDGSDEIKIDPQGLASVASSTSSTAAACSTGRTGSATA